MAVAQYVVCIPTEGAPAGPVCTAGYTQALVDSPFGEIDPAAGGEIFAYCFMSTIMLALFAFGLRKIIDVVKIF